MPPLSLVLIDSETLVRAALSNLLCTIGNYEVGAEAATTEEALLQIERLKPHIAITEMVVSGGSSIDLILEVNRRRLPTAMLALAHFDNIHIVNNALCAGAKGFIAKCCNIEELIKGLEVVASGQTYLPEKICNLLTSNKNRDSTTSSQTDILNTLSIREREVFYLLADGLQNTGIAKKLFISPRTVETHRARIVKKLGVKSNGELIRFAIKNGLTVI